MSPELEKKLADEFPFMRRGLSLEEQRTRDSYIGDSYETFGIECNDGWFNLIWNLCQEIVDCYKEEERELDIFVDQVKEKYGGLRFYYHIDSEGTNNISPNEAGFSERIEEIVSRYEEDSENVCEECGAEGRLRNDRPYILTLCDACAALIKY